MTDAEWFKLFDETKEKFHWFFTQYGQERIWDSLISARKRDDKDYMITKMNLVWFLLPDNRFNIMENPEGWSEFLNLIEE